MANLNEYFNIIKYLDSFEIDSFVLEHLNELQIRFENYLKQILASGKEEAMTFFHLELYDELLYSHQIEDSRIVSPAEFLNYDLIATGKCLTNKKICNIQKNLLKNSNIPYPIGEYRQVPVRVFSKDEVVYNAPSPDVVPLFMSDFVKFYNKNCDTLIHTNPFIKSALIHFLFVKIHPFVDGNGRVSRVLHNLKFTDLVNKTYTLESQKELDLKVSPLNMSYSIYNNKQAYYKRLADIEFSAGADINRSVNKWLDFLLYMYEEQLNYNEHSNRLKNLKLTLQRVKK